MLDALIPNEIEEYAVLEAYFLQALTWSLGGGLLEDGRTKFDTQLKYLASMSAMDENPKAGV